MLTMLQTPADRDTWIAVFAMNDAVLPETVAMVARCSKTMRRELAPVLELRMCNKATAHGVILRRFPGITGLPDPSQQQDASLYHALLGSYFSPSPGRLSRMHLFITVQRLGNAFRTAAAANDVHIAMCMFDELRSAKGRAILLEAIAGWRSVVRQALCDENVRRVDLAQLDRFERIVRHDFAVRFDGIGSEHQYYAV
jgi:hypothetical protein